jgi:exonuclease SbcD
MREAVRILLLADTHLGFDLPVRPRIERRRRGHDFLANYATALQPAFDRAVDIVVHGGDVFNRSRPVPSLAYQAFEPLTRVADAGVPVYVVPGNHERGRLPHLRFAQHKRIHIFDRPRTFVADVRGVRVALAGFPSERDEVRTKFTTLLQETQWLTTAADVRLLCLHQCVEGATVGPANFTFTSGADVIRGAEIPLGLAAVLSGHIHRHQILLRDLRGRALAAPVLYPGSIERTSIAEADEAKGYMIVDVALGDDGTRVDWSFRTLPARPLVRHTLSVAAHAEAELERQLQVIIAELPADAVLTIRVEGTFTQDAARVFSAARLRALAPATMNIEVRPTGGFGREPGTEVR